MTLSKKAREAQRAYKRAWAAANREKVNDYQRKWKRENPEKCAEYQRRYWERKADADFQQLREALGGNNNGC